MARNRAWLKESSASFYRFYIAWRSFASGEAYFSYFFDITKTGDFLFLVAKFQMV